MRRDLQKQTHYFIQKLALTIPGVSTNRSQSTATATRLVHKECKHFIFCREITVKSLFCEKGDSVFAMVFFRVNAQCLMNRVYLIRPEGSTRRRQRKFLTRVICNTSSFTTTTKQQRIHQLMMLPGLAA